MLQRRTLLGGVMAKVELEEKFCEVRNAQATPRQPKKYANWVIYQPAVLVTVVATTEEVEALPVPRPSQRERRQVYEHRRR
jgi:hypothetical protein